MSEAVTLDTLTTKLAISGVGWDKDRWARFINDLTPEEQMLEAQMYSDAAQGPGTDAWAEALDIITVVLSVAGTIAANVTGVAGAISAVQAVISNKPTAA